MTLTAKANLGTGFMMTLFLLVLLVALINPGSVWVFCVLAVLGLGNGVYTMWALTRFGSSLREIALGVEEGAGQIASAEAQVSSASQGLAGGASEQAASLEETSASATEISATARQNAEHANAAAGLMEETQKAVVQATASLEQMVRSMSEIKSSSDQVSKIIKVIDEIAFQTNILALNAAVEAARAGEAGMGFAVVADEVRNLAQRCAQAAKDTSTLIATSISTTNEGTAKMDGVMQAVGAITESANKAKSLVDDVTAGSREQAQGIEQISTTIHQMEQMTQRNAATAEESAAAGNELSAQANSLDRLVGQLREVAGGQTVRHVNIRRPRAGQR